MAKRKKESHRRLIERKVLEKIERACFLCGTQDESLLRCIHCMRDCESVCDYNYRYQHFDTDGWKCLDCIDKEALALFNSDSMSRALPDLDCNNTTTGHCSENGDMPGGEGTEEHDGDSEDNVSPKPQQISAKPPSPEPECGELETSMRSKDQISTVEHQSDDLQSAVKTIQTHLDCLHVLCTQNSELQQEVAELKKEVNVKEEAVRECNEDKEKLQKRLDKWEKGCHTVLGILKKIKELVVNGDSFLLEK